MNGTSLCGGADWEKGIVMRSGLEVDSAGQEVDDFVSGGADECGTGEGEYPAEDYTTSPDPADGMDTSRCPDARDCASDGVRC